MARRQTVMLEIDGVCDASGDLTIDANRLTPNKLFCVQLISVHCDDQADAKCNVGMVKGVAERWLETLTLTTAGHIYAYAHSVWLPSDWTIRLVWHDAGNKSRCQAYVYGYLMEA